MSVASNLAASWDALELADMLRAASWTAAGGAAVAGLVIFDAPGFEPLEGVASVDYSALYRVSDWATVREGDTITVGTAYRVREVTPVDDGLLARAFITRRP